MLKDGVTLISGSFKIYEQFPDAEGVSKNEQDSSQSKKQRADGQMCARKRKKSAEETEEREEPRTSSFSKRDKKEPAEKLTCSKFFLSCLICL